VPLAVSGGFAAGVWAKAGCAALPRTVPASSPKTTRFFIPDLPFTVPVLSARLFAQLPLTKEEHKLRSSMEGASKS
jgi:hypothetical protein